MKIARFSLLALAGLFAAISSTEAATINEWLFDAPPTNQGGSPGYYAVNEISGGNAFTEQKPGQYMDLQANGGPFYSTVGGQALFLDTGFQYQAYGRGPYTNWGTVPQWSIEMWVNPLSGVGGTQDVFSDMSQVLRLSATAGGFTLTGYIFDGSYHAVSSGATVIAENTWTHIAMTYTGSILTLYVGGTSVGTLSYTTGGLTSTGQGTSMGSFGSGNFYKGYMDEIRESDVALLPGDGSGNGTLAWNASLATPVPEPSTLALIGLGLGGGLYIHRRRRK